MLASGNRENIQTLLLDCEIGLEDFLFLCEGRIPGRRGHCMVAEFKDQGQQPVQLSICIVSNACHIFGSNLLIIMRSFLFPSALSSSVTVFTREMSHVSHQPFSTLRMNSA